MRTQAKRFWQIAILAALAVVPVACGDEGNNDEELPPPPPGDGDTTPGDGDGDTTPGDGDGDGDVASDAGTDGGPGVDPCPAPKTSTEFLNQCAKESIQRVKFDNATRLPSQTLPPL